MRVTHGCVRMYPEDIEHLFGMVPVGTPVRLVDQPPVKVGRFNGELFVESHEPLEEDNLPIKVTLEQAQRAIIARSAPTCRAWIRRHSSRGRTGQRHACCGQCPAPGHAAPPPPPPIRPHPPRLPVIDPLTPIPRPATPIRPKACRQRAFHPLTGQLGQSNALPRPPFPAVPVPRPATRRMWDNHAQSTDCYGNKTPRSMAGFLLPKPRLICTSTS